MVYTFRFLCILYYAIYKANYGDLCQNKLESKPQKWFYKHAKQLTMFHKQIQWKCLLFEKYE